MDKGTDIIYEKIQLPRGYPNHQAFVLHNVLTPEQCQTYINETEKKGYDLALVNIGGGRQQEMTDVRNSSRHIWDSEPEAKKLWGRIQQLIPKIFKNRKVIGLNERLRFLRYDPGEYFKPHMDGMYERQNGERSYMTILLYLNEGYKGGATTFLSWNSAESVPLIPKTGSALIFQHDILHEGSVLQEGRKYALRTDIMYSATRDTD